MVTEEEVVEALQECYDPELGLDVHTLGLIYEIDIDGSDLNILMTFTSMGCPYGPMLIDEIRSRLKEMEGVEEVEVEVTFDPPWEPSDEVRAMLGV